MLERSSLFGLVGVPAECPPSDLVRFGWTRLVCTPTHSVIAHTLPTHVVWQPSPYICSIG